MKTVLLFRTSFSPQNRFEYKAMFDFAGQHDWQIRTVEYMNAAVSRHWKDNPAPQPKVRELLALWKPDGCLVECGGSSSEPWLGEFGDVPTVYLDRPLIRNNPKVVCVSSDADAIAAAAAKELLSLGIDDFAYASWCNPVPWNEDRGNAFADLIRQHGKRLTSFTVPQQESVGSNLDDLIPVLQALPKPCGVFAANDESAAAVILSCCKIGIAIPDEIAVIGVDNDEEICENLPVTLSSIEQDMADTGLLAARLLERMMSPDGTPVKSLHYGIKRIVRRASANGLRNLDRRVAAAIEFIRTNVCKQITPADVAEKMSCSIRHAHRLFMGVRRHTILDEIHLRRIDVAKEQLQAHILSFESIAELCGYASLTDFGRVFKRYTGLTPRNWQKQQCKR